MTDHINLEHKILEKKQSLILKDIDNFLANYKGKPLYVKVAKEAYETLKKSFKVGSVLYYRGIQLIRY